MSVLDKINASLSYDLQSKPWAAFVNQNPGIAPSVVEYVTRGGPRPTDASLGANKYALARVYEEDARREAGGPPPPVGGKLRWAPPALMNPQTRTLTNAARSIPKGSGDLIVKCGEQLGGVIGQVEGYNDVVAIAGLMRGGTSGSSGHLVPRELTGVFHLEGWDVLLSVAADFMAVRWRVPIVQVQATYMEVTDAGGSFHADLFQTQEAEIDELRVDRVTAKTDYQGFFMSNEVNSRPGGRSKVTKTILSRLLYLRGAQGNPASYFFKALPPRAGTDLIGTVEMYDVWAPDPPISYPWTSFSAWSGGTMKWGSFLTTKKHANGSTYPFLKFSTPQDVVPVGTYKGQQCDDCGIRGDGGIWVGTPPADLLVGAPANVGLGYESPGYL